MTADEELEKIKARMLAKMQNPTPQGPWVNGEVLELNGSNFDSSISAAKHPVLIDFWAGWCQPCMMMKPLFEGMAREYSGKAHFGKVDVDRNQSLAQKYGVMSIPNFIVFSGGRPVERVVGAVGRPALEAALRKHMT